MLTAHKTDPCKKLCLAFCYNFSLPTICRTLVSSAVERKKHRSNPAHAWLTCNKSSSISGDFFALKSLPAKLRHYVPLYCLLTAPRCLPRPRRCGAALRRAGCSLLSPEKSTIHHRVTYCPCLLSLDAWANGPADSSSANYYVTGPLGRWRRWWLATYRNERLWTHFRREGSH